MIPQATITYWSRRARWSSPDQVEEDPVLSRLIIEIATNPLLGDELIFRGGTCLEKLHLPEPRRHSEDLEYVRVVRRPDPYRPRRLANPGHQNGGPRWQMNLGLCWWTVMSAFELHGTPLVDDPDRVGPVSALGVDQTSFVRANRSHRTRYATGLIDLSVGEEGHRHRRRQRSC